jgi:hypothetical protein
MAQFSDFKHHSMVLTKVGRWARSKGSQLCIYMAVIKLNDTFVIGNN